MERAAHVLLIALLLVPATSVGAVGVSPGTTPGTATNASEPAENHIAVLTLGADSPAVIANESFGVGAAISLSRAGFEARLERYAFRARLNRSDATDAVVEAAVTEVRARARALRRTERTLWRRYANGTIDETTLLRNLAETYVRARELEHWYDRLGSILNIPFFRNPTLTALNGPVRSRIPAMLRSDETRRIYVSTSPDGIALATISDGRYVRSAYRPDRQSFPPEPLAASQAFNLFLLERYGLSNVDVRPSIRGLKGTPAVSGNTFYRYGFEFDRGSITAYLDGGTKQVFYEIQTRDLDRLGGGPGVTTTADGIRLIVNRSYPGGPLRIATVDNSTGRPVRSTIVVDGVRTTTGTDGVVWTLTPPGERFTVTAIRGGARINVTVTPLAPEPLGGST